jgi:hypothetical protein
VRTLIWVVSLLSVALIIAALFLGYRESGSIKSRLFPRGKRPMHLVLVLASFSMLSNATSRQFFPAGAIPNWIGIAVSFAFTLTAIWFLARRPRPLA